MSRIRIEVVEFIKIYQNGRAYLDLIEFVSIIKNLKDRVPIDKMR